jgi:hypothetical protein
VNGGVLCQGVLLNLFIGGPLVPASRGAIAETNFVQLARLLISYLPLRRKQAQELTLVERIRRPMHWVPVGAIGSMHFQLPMRQYDKDHPAASLRLSNKTFPEEFQL